jgi:hypothetical protein
MNKLVTNIKEITDKTVIFHSDNQHEVTYSDEWGTRTIFGVRNEDGFMRNYLKDNNIPLYFSDKSLVNDINNNKTLEYTRTLESDKITIMELEMHPIEPPHVYDSLVKFYNQWDELIPLMQQKKLISLIYFGWEADDWNSKHENIYGLKYSNDKKYLMNDGEISTLDMIMKFQEEFNIPKESMIFIHSNLRGDELQKYYYKNETNLPEVWYDYWYEFESFVRPKHSSPMDYPFETYFDELKKNINHKFLRVNRTWHKQRDMLAYFIEKIGLFNECNWEHKELQKDQLKSELEILLEESSGNIDEEFQRMVSNCNPIDYDVINKFTEKLPLISSIEERSKFELLGDHISNETIPSSIYTTAPISYISTSFPARDNQVFIHMSTFNPIYNYHPILFNGNPYTLREMKRLGFKSFDWLFDEKYDEVPSERERLIYSLVEFEKISKLSNNQILDLIYNNQDKLIFNRELMLSFKSYHRFFDKMNNHLKKYYGDK